MTGRRHNANRAAPVDLHRRPDWQWRTAADDSPAELTELWEAAVSRSDHIVDQALVDGGLDRRSVYVTRSGESPNLRRALFDLIEEYARHVGHADLIRESMDGLTGEDLN